MQIPTLPDIGLEEVGATATIGIFLLGVYRYKANRLETARERENRLKNLMGKGTQKGKFIISVDNVEFEEDSRTLYRIKRWLLRPVDGTMYVTIRLHDIGLPEEFWDMDHADVFYETIDYPVECVNSEMTSQFTALVFKLGTARYPDLQEFLDDFTNLLKVLEDSGTASVVDTRSGGFPF